jgi:hypothetical protein
VSTKRARETSRDADDASIDRSPSDGGTTNCRRHASLSPVHLDLALTVTERQEVIVELARMSQTPASILPDSGMTTPAPALEGVSKETADALEQYKQRDTSKGALVLTLSHYTG